MQIKNKSIKYEFVSEIPSKKNSKRIISFGNGRRGLISSKNYLQWEEEQLWLLKTHKHKTVKKCDSIVVGLYFEYNRRKDLSNVWEGVGDLLVKAGILEDDNFNVIPILQISYLGKRSPSLCTVEIINPQYE